jgi:hypothetical protein
LLTPGKCLSPTGVGLGHLLEHRLGVDKTQRGAVVADQAQPFEEAVWMLGLLSKWTQSVFQDGEERLNGHFLAPHAQGGIGDAQTQMLGNVASQCSATAEDADDKASDNLPVLDLPAQPPMLGLVGSGHFLGLEPE